MRGTVRRNSPSSPAPRSRSVRRVSFPLLAIALVSSVALSACGGGSSSASSSTTSSTSAATSASNSSKASTTAYAACMQKHGVKFSGFGLGGTGGSFPTGGSLPSGGSFNSSAFQKASAASREPAPEGIRHEAGRLLGRGLCRVPQLPEAPRRDVARCVFRHCQLDHVDDAQHEERVRPKGACRVCEPAAEGIRHGDGRPFERSLCRLPQLPEAPRRDLAQRVFRRGQFDHVNHGRNQEHCGPEGARRLCRSRAEVHPTGRNKLDIDDKLMVLVLGRPSSPVSPDE